MSWSGARADAAAERILDAAAELFVERGVAETGMADVAAAAGCSRATLYRYFESRGALHRAFAHREARRIVAAATDHVRSIADPDERRAEAIVSVAEAIRQTPELVAWHRPGAIEILSEVLNDSDVVDAFCAAFLGGDRDRVRDLGRWIVRVIESLVLSPGNDRDDEVRMVRSFVLPLLPQLVR